MAAGWQRVPKSQLRMPVTFRWRTGNADESMQGLHLLCRLVHGLKLYGAVAHYRAWRRRHRTRRRLDAVANAARAWVHGGSVCRCADSNHGIPALARSSPGAAADAACRGATAHAAGLDGLSRRAGGEVARAIRSAPAAGVNAAVA